MNISVVIATYNRKTQLKSCLTAVSRQTFPPIEIIIVDDASTDGTEEMIANQFPHIKYLRLMHNGGPAIARNRGVQTAKGDIIAFTDDDCIVPPGWLQQLTAAWEKHPEVVGVSGYQEAADTLIATNPIAQTEHLTRLHRWGERAHSEQLGGAEVPGFGTNNVAYKRHIFLKLGGFDESFPVAAGEDYDFKVRVAVDHQLLYIPLKVEHHRTYTLKAQWHAFWRRGIGVYYFEAKRGHAPSIGRIFLRLGKRCWQLLPNLTKFPWRVAFIITISHIADALGQLQTAIKKYK